MNPTSWAAFHKGYSKVFNASLVIILVWTVVAHIIFAFRNPHLTTTERFLRFGQALRFEKVLP